MRRVFVIAPAGRNRERLEELLDSVDAEVGGRAESLDNVNAEDVVEGAEIVLIDASSDATDELLQALEETELLKDTHVILIMEQGAPLLVNQAVRAGVRAVLPVDVSAGQLATALDAVSQDLLVLHPSELQAARTSRSSASGQLVVEPLTSREREVLQLLARGLGNKEIAARMKISEHTVKFHVASILGKLGASTRTEAVAVGLTRGLVLI